MTLDSLATIANLPSKLLLWFTTSVSLLTGHSALASSFPALNGIVPQALSQPTLKFIAKPTVCRDCPFPIRVANDRWLMPNRHLEVRITEAPWSRARSEVTVELYIAGTGELVASGQALLTYGKRSFATLLYDLNGNSLLAKIQWSDDSHEQVQIDLSCASDGCSLRRFL